MATLKGHFEDVSMAWQIPSWNFQLLRVTIDHLWNCVCVCVCRSVHQGALDFTVVVDVKNSQMVPFVLSNLHTTSDFFIFHNIPNLVGKHYPWVKYMVQPCLAHISTIQRASLHHPMARGRSIGNPGFSKPLDFVRFHKITHIITHNMIFNREYYSQYGSQFWDKPCHKPWPRMLIFCKKTTVGPLKVTKYHWNSYLILVGGLEHLDYFPIQLGMSSSQLTNSIICQRGRSTSNQ